MGENWTLSDAGITEQDILSLAIDPFVAGTVYAGTQRGIFKSSNAGMSWAASGLRSMPIFSLVVQASKPLRIYASTGQGLFRTSNDGASWDKLKSLHENTWIAPLAVNPQDPNIVYSYVGRSKDVIVSNGWADGGLYRSNDYGEGWQKISSIPASILAIIPGKSNTMYAGTGR